MCAISSQITSLTIFSSTVYLDTDQRKHQRSASLAFVRGIHRRPVNSPHKWPVTRKMFPFDDVNMIYGIKFHILLITHYLGRVKIMLVVCSNTNHLHSALSLLDHVPLDLVNCLLLSGVPDLWDRNKILRGGDLSHLHVPDCIWVFFYFVWFVFVHHNLQFYFELYSYCYILDNYLL